MHLREFITVFYKKPTSSFLRKQNPPKKKKGIFRLSVPSKINAVVIKYLSSCKTVGQRDCAFCLKEWSLEYPLSMAFFRLLHSFWEQLLCSEHGSHGPQSEKGAEDLCRSEPVRGESNPFWNWWFKVSPCTPIICCGKEFGSVVYSASQKICRAEGELCFYLSALQLQAAHSLSYYSAPHLQHLYWFCLWVSALVMCS